MTTTTTTTMTTTTTTTMRAARGIIITRIMAVMEITATMAMATAMGVARRHRRRHPPVGSIRGLNDRSIMPMAMEGMDIITTAVDMAESHRSSSSNNSSSGSNINDEGDSIRPTRFRTFPFVILLRRRRRRRRQRRRSNITVRV
jgi:hypothetical protein